MLFFHFNFLSVMNMWIMCIIFCFLFLLSQTAKAQHNTNSTNNEELVSRSKEFIECLKWELQNGSDYTIFNKTLTYFYRNLSYDVSNYVIVGSSAYVCIPEKARPLSYYIDFVYISAWAVSIIALVASLIFHRALPSGANVYEPRPLFYHMLSLLAFYILEIVFQAGPRYSQPVCYILAIWGQYSLRAAFAWLNVVTFDVWRTFHPKRIFILNSRASCFKFTCQSIYAWGLPAVIVGGSMLLIFSSAPRSPGYNERCLVSMYYNEAQVIFFYTTSSLPLFVNIVFFVLTVMNLKKFSKEIALVNHQIQSQMLRMYLKLLGVTGVFWLLEVLEWAMIPLALNPIIWIVPDVLSALQGFFLFLIYNCNSTVKNQIRQQLVRKFGRRKSSSTTRITRIRST